MRHVGVLRRDPQRALLAHAADEDRRSLRLDGSRFVERRVELVVLAVERRRFLREHRLGDRQRLLEPVHPFADRREVIAVAGMLDVIPGRPEPEDRAPPGDHVERRRLLREQRRVPIRDPRDQRPEPDPTRLSGKRRKRHPALEHRFGDRADALDLIEVVHHGDEAEAGLFRGTCLCDDALEESIGRYLGVGVAGEVETEPNAHGGSLLRPRDP